MVGTGILNTIDTFPSAILAWCTAFHACQYMYVPCFADCLTVTVNIQIWIDQWEKGIKVARALFSSLIGQF